MLRSVVHRPAPLGVVHRFLKMWRVRELAPVRLPGYLPAASMRSWVTRDRRLSRRFPRLPRRVRRLVDVVQDAPEPGDIRQGVALALSVRLGHAGSVLLGVAAAGGVVIADVLVIGRWER